MFVKNVFVLWRRFWKEFVGIIFLVSFLLVLLNILIGISAAINKAWESLKDRLGIYIYIQESGHSEGEIRSALLNMRRDLSVIGVRARYIPKEKAINLLENELPQIVKDFEEFGIQNPLPDTVIVDFSSIDQYHKVESVIDKYKDFIKNSDNIISIEKYEIQKQRVKNVIWFANVVRFLSIGLVGLLGAVIVYILILVLQLLFYGFYPQLEVEKLLGASFWQIKMPFLASIIVVLVIWWGIALGSIYYLSNILIFYVVKIFNQDNIETFKYITNPSLISKTVAIEILILIAISAVVANFFLNRMLKKV